LRVFDPAMNLEGTTVLTSSATQDIRVAFSYKQKTFIHVIDEYIDNERAKVTNDLEFSGCVEAMNLVPRTWVPHDAHDATGDRLRTDGAIAVMKISDCKNPRTTPDTALNETGRFKRSTRNTFLYIRDDLYRGNLIYTGISGVRWLKKYLSTKDQIKPEAGAWRTTDQIGSVFQGLGDAPRPQEEHTGRIDREFQTDKTLEQRSRELERAHRWDPSHYEIGIFGGYLRYPNTRNEVVFLLVVPETGVVDADNTFAATLAHQFENGGLAGISVTLNSWKWFSNQFAFSYTRSTWDFTQILILPTQETTFEDVPLATRQFEYNLLFNLRPPKSR
jgi:hypothetical protein